MIQQDKIKMGMCRPMSKIVYYSSQKGWRIGDQKEIHRRISTAAGMERDGCHWLTTSKPDTEKTRGKRRRGQAEEFTGWEGERVIYHTHF